MRLLADENFNNQILRGLQKRDPELDIVRVQDTEIYGAPDPDVLEWAAKENRILLTHDAKTMPRYVYERVAAGLPVPRVIEVKREIAVGQVIDELLTIAGASDPAEWANQIVYLPL